ncbi:hypothetical protein L6452_34422 [Arctium lappa]|uniref:Uncharacterized protein n=1 Tax=Arctium lappa TaxID=4217 RepID=A0ACB8YJE0_ARCLA|nr:hypothetical protein L6452_34422 [Arctium lappa]
MNVYGGIIKMVFHFWRVIWYISHLKHLSIWVNGLNIKLLIDYERCIILHKKQKMGSHGLFFHCSQIYPQHNINFSSINVQRGSTITCHASKSTGFPFNSIFKKCETCGGQGAIDCVGCKGTGKNKKNGNIFERWKCYDCQGFGLRSCPSCGKGGLTPEQRGER